MGTQSQASRKARKSVSVRPGFVPGKRSVDCDPLTGEPLRRDTLKLRMPTDRVDSRPTRVAYEDGWRAETTPPPLRVHSADVETATPADGATTPDGRGALGAPRYSRGMRDFLQSGLDNQRREQRADDVIWHRTAYGRGRVYAAFVARYGAQAGKLAYLAALAYATGDQDPASIALQAGKPARWVVAMAELARKVAGRTGTRGNTKVNA